jgi:hypothetical protein
MNPVSILKRTALSAVALSLLCVAHTSAANAVEYAETFEVGAGAQGASTGSWTDGEVVANGSDAWYSGTSDQSIVTNIGSYVPLPGGVVSPISPTTPDYAEKSRVLRLDTQGDTLTNELSGATLADKDIWVDQMVKLVVSDDYPTAVSNDLEVKAAVFLNSSSNLVVYHGTYDSVGGDYDDPVYTDTGESLTPDTWYRLTIRLDQSTVGIDTEEAFKVFINGVVVSTSAGYGSDGDWTDEWQSAPPGGGPWFLTAARRSGGQQGASPGTVNAICYEGSGWVDDILVTDNAPSFDPVAVEWTIDQTIVGNGNANPGGAITIADGDSTSVVYTANEFYRIDSIVLDPGGDQGVSGVKMYTQDYNNVTEDIDVDVTFAEATQAQTGLDAPSGWASGYYGTEAAAGADPNLGEDYLLGVDPTESTGYTLTIISIEVTDVVAGDVTVEVLLTDDDDGDAPQPTTINGELTLLGADTVGGATTEVAGAEIDGATFDASGEATIVFYDVDLDNDLELTAVVQAQD